MIVIFFKKCTFTHNCIFADVQCELLKIEVPSLLLAHHIHVLLFSKVLIFEASDGCMSACNNYIPVGETVGCTD